MESKEKDCTQSTDTEQAAEPEKDKSPAEGLNWRFYEQKFPKKGDIVMGKITQNCQDLSRFVFLPEYNIHDVIIDYSSERLFKQYSKRFQIDSNHCFTVLRVDTDRGYVDLYRRKPAYDLQKSFKAKFEKNLTINKVLRLTAAEVNVDVLKLYQEIAWPLEKRFNSISEAFLLSLKEPDFVFSAVDIDDLTRDVLRKHVSKLVMPRISQMVSRFKLTWFTFEGIDGIKSALLKAKNHIMKTEEIEINVRLLASPLYESYVWTPNLQKGTEQLFTFNTMVKKNIEEIGGTFKLIKKPRHYYWQEG